ncbi:MAG: hypothetical protein ACRDTN_13655 [Mycobacterium sp.]
MNTNLIRGATLTLGAAAGAVLAGAFLSGGVAAADDTIWIPNGSSLTGTEYEGFGYILGSGTETWDSVQVQNGVLTPTYEGLQGNATETDILGFGYSTLDVTGDATGSAATGVPAGTVIDLSRSLFDFFNTETVAVPGAGLFGLPEITETFFGWGWEFSI